MRVFYVLYTPPEGTVGEIVFWTESDEPQTLEGMGSAILAGPVEPDHYVADVDTAPVLAIRPALVPFLDGLAPHTLDMAGLPAGTLVRATNNIGTTVETSDPIDPITLTNHGVYSVRIEPPFPYQVQEQEVTASA